MKDKRLETIIFICTLVFFLIIILRPYSSKASPSVGTIDSVYKYAKGIDANDVKINFGLFKGSVNVVVTDTGVTGFAWGENIGWVNLSPNNGGVINNGEGVLSGFATSEFGGLINFKPVGGGVTINYNGEFMGYASSEKFGRISFNCLNDNSCAIDDFKVKTDWRPISVRGTNDPSTPPAVVIQNPNNDTGKVKPVETGDTTKTNPKPLPVIDTGQYAGGGDTVKNNEIKINPNGGIVYVLPVDKPAISTENKNTDLGLIKKTENFGTLLQNKTEEVRKQAEIISQTPAVNISTKTVTTAGVAGGSTAVFSSVAGSTLSFSEFILNFFRLWSLFLSAIGLRKKTKPWGTVYDSVTKQPIDPAYVVLQDKENNEIATAITDMDGRFGFLVTEGAYKIYVRKNNYSFPSRKLFGKSNDELYSNLYFGEFLDFKKDELIIKNIPMDPEKFDWNEFTKRSKKLLKFNSPYAKILAQISNILFYFGFILAVLLLIINTFNFYNIAIIFLYFILFLIRKVGVGVKSFGTISENNTGFPLSYSVIKIYKKGSKNEIFHRVADKYGHYYCLLPKGDYYIKIEKKNSDESYTSIYTSSVFTLKRGILNKDFKV